MSSLFKYQQHCRRMDIEALLAESNMEAVASDSAYDTDEFEDDANDTIDSSSRGGDSNGMGSDKLAILRAAAAKVALEDKRVADKVFHETADDISVEIKIQKKAERDPESILADASRTVNEHHNRQDDTEADKYRAIEEDEEDEDEGEDDEENTCDDPQLNQSLLFASRNDKNENVKNALKKGAYYFTRDRHGWTALHWAASKGCDEVIEVLLDFAKKNDKNVNKFINAQDSITGWTALHVSELR